MKSERSKLPVILILVILLSTGVTACTKKDKPKPEEPGPGNSVKSWVTTGDRAQLLAAGREISFISSVPAGQAVLRIDTAITYQEVEGYGAALTGSSAWLINRKLTPQTRQALLNELFDPEAGIGISYLRLTMGASDFSLSDFTYNDLPAGQTDFGLNNFSLSQDRDDLIQIGRAHV